MFRMLTHCLWNEGIKVNTWAENSSWFFFHSHQNTLATSLFRKFPKKSSCVLDLLNGSNIIWQGSKLDPQNGALIVGIMTCVSGTGCPQHLAERRPPWGSVPGWARPPCPRRWPRGRWWRNTTGGVEVPCRTPASSRAPSRCCSTSWLLNKARTTPTHTGDLHHDLVSSDSASLFYVHYV